MRKIGEGKEKGEEIVWVRLENEKQKWTVLKKKRNLRGRK